MGCLSYIENSMNDEKQLIQSVLEGDKRAFSGLIDRYKRLVSHIVYKIVKAEEDRQDIAQDVFVKVYQNLSSFKGDCKLSSWIGRIAYNTSLNHIGKKRDELWDDLSPEMSLDEIISDGITPEELAERNETSEWIRREIDRLPAPFNVIITLYHLYELTYNEIAEITGMPDGTVKSYLFRARKKLKALLEKKTEVEDWLS